MPQLTGAAAVLAQIRAKQQASAQAAAERRQVVVCYASATGTAEEIARSIHTACTQHGVKAKLCSLDEFGYRTLQGKPQHVLVIVASSTGDGDPPVSGERFWTGMRKTGQEVGSLAGLQFTILGLGDSNYTKFMHVPRAIRQRLEELGGQVFYQHAEADEVDGLEDTVDQWTAGLWAPLKAATGSNPPKATAGYILRSSDVKAAQEGDGGGAVDAAVANMSEGELMEALRNVADDKKLEGVPAMPECRVGVELEEGEAAQQQWDREVEGPSQEDLSHVVPDGKYSARAPFYATLAGASLLTSPTSRDRRVIEARVSLKGSNIAYSTGDSIALMPENSPALVSALLARLGLSAQSRSLIKLTTTEGQPADPTTTLAHLGWPCTVQCAFQRRLDITGVPKKSLLRVLAEHCSDAGEKAALKFLVTRGGKEQYAQLVEHMRPALLDLLTAFPTCNPPLPALLDALPPLAARHYSIATSPLAHPDECAVAFSVVKRASGYAPRGGVATTWLEAQCAGFLGEERVEEAGEGLPYAATSQVAVYVSHAGMFRCPEDLSVPVVMVGPGTGVAPFKGFLEHRRELLKTFSGKPAPCLLFFGCRKADEDQLYRAEMEAFQAEGVLSKYHVAYSRSGHKKVYVQTLMKGVAEQLAELIVEDEGYVFVCGDGQAMARDVHNCLEKEVFVKAAEMEQREAQQALKDAARNGKYVRDVWS